MNEAHVSSSTSISSGSTPLASEWWFLPVDILRLISILLAIIFSFIFLFLVVKDRAYRSATVILVTNSCCTGLLSMLILFWSGVITLHNDIRRMAWDGSLCVLRSYLGYVAFAASFYSYLLQAIYRYVIVVHPTRLFWHSRRVQLALIGFSWIFAFLHAIPHVVTGQLQYFVDDQLCQIALQRSWSTVYNFLCVYNIPMTGIIFIYFRLVRYVKEIGGHIIPANTLCRAQRELKMVFRIVVLVSILLVLGIPYTIFIFMGFIAQPPKYHFRIGFAFIDVAQVFIVLALFRFTDQVKTSLIRRIAPRRNTMVAATVRLF